jgi:hypothetical protein
MHRPLAVSLVGLALAACSSPKPADSAAPDTLSTGRDCASAEGTCGDGRCVVNVKNDCAAPITCQLRVESICQNSNGDTGPANASSKRVTQLGHSSASLDARVECGQGTPVTTRVERFDCI